MNWPKNNTLNAVMHWFSNSIAENYEPQEVRSITEIVFKHVLQLSRIDMIMNKDHRLTESQLVNFFQIIKNLNKNMPVQYILGQTEFFHLTLLLNEHVLIPRPETEELVEWIVNDYKNDSGAQIPLMIWDIATGSGAIALALASNIRNAKVRASDILPAALDTARKNAHINDLEVDYFCHDILHESNSEGLFDIIVSNPPYIRPSEKRFMKDNVLKFEPHIALFVPEDDPIIFYRKIAGVSFFSLKPGGTVYVEINEAFGEEVVELFREEGFVDITLRKDIFGKDRFLKSKKKSIENEAIKLNS